MAFTISRRVLTGILFFTLFTLAVGDVLEQIKESPSHTFDSIKDKISISTEDLQHILRLATQKQADFLKDRSWTTKIFGILFPSSRPAVNALLATAYISGPPNFLLALCPPNIDPSSLSIMVAFAVGGLLGDTFFHLLPEIFLGEDDDGSKVRLVHLEPNRNTLLGVFIFIGLATFMAMDKALRIATGGAHSHSHTGEHNIREQAQKFDVGDYRLLDDLSELAKKESREEQRERLSNKPYNDTRVNGKKTRDIIAHIASTNQEIRRRNTGTSENQQQSQQKPKEVSIYADEDDNNNNDTGLEATRTTSPTQSKSSPPTTKEKKDLNPSVKLAGLLNLVADFTHNITDGLALATSFYSSPTLGATTTMAVFFHEIPHEVGDFALLIQSGFSKHKAMGAQFLTAVGAFLGTIIGILVQEYGSGEDKPVVGGMREGLFGTSLQWSDMLLPFTAGTFLFVGTVGVIPELLENERGSTRVQELKRTLSQFVAMAVGALIMVAISWH
ncbi:hypothetical protein LTR64_001106 [Lithohypha guttulata]|uniref:uncharacterized protein n=1 Tax=Lithohypha guttulata TaxID=1690604 RepID=UPI002DDF59BA|nr:hypothetical protein LTR51_003300 [Lithohypha guttulata]